MSLSSICSHFEFDSPATFGSKKLPQRERFSALSKLTGVIPASLLDVRPTPEMISSGIRELDLLTGGLPRGCLSEVYGPASSGRTSILLAVLAASTKRDEVCALVDVSDALDPVSARAAGVDFGKLLWARCGSSLGKIFPANTKEHRLKEGPVEKALRVTDLLLQSGGFGLVIIDLGDIPVKLARRIPLTSWFRFQRAVENTPTVLFVIASVPCAQTCASLLLKLRASGKRIPALSFQLSTEEKTIPAHSQLLNGLEIEGEFLRSRMGRKPLQSVARFATRAVRAG
jgi:hypothetical protein